MKTKLLLTGMAMLAFATQANAALSVGDANYLGLINDGIPSDPSDQVTYINNLITLDAGDGDTVIGTETYNREDSTLAGPFDTASLTGGSFEDDSGSNSVSLDKTYQYVLAKYDAENAGTHAWYFADGVSGDITVPQKFDGVQYDVSNVKAYNPVDGGGGGGGSGGVVPEPASIALLGLGSLLAGAGLRRRQKKLGEELAS